MSYTNISRSTGGSSIIIDNFKVQSSSGDPLFTVSPTGALIYKSLEVLGTQTVIHTTKAEADDPIILLGKDSLLNSYAGIVTEFKNGANSFGDYFGRDPTQAGWSLITNMTNRNLSDSGTINSGAYGKLYLGSLEAIGDIKSNTVTTNTITVGTVSAVTCNSMKYNIGSVVTTDEGILNFYNVNSTLTGTLAKTTARILGGWANVGGNIGGYLNFLTYSASYPNGYSSLLLGTDGSGKFTGSLSCGSLFTVSGTMSSNTITTGNITGSGSTNTFVGNADQTFTIGTSASSVNAQRLIFRCSGSNEPSNYLSSISSARDDAGGRLMFSTSSNAIPAVLTERMRIDSSGNIGIGTGIVTPTATLHVNGNLRTNNLTTASGVDYSEILHNGYNSGGYKSLLGGNSVRIVTYGGTIGGVIAFDIGTASGAVNSPITFTNALGIASNSVVTCASDIVAGRNLISSGSTNTFVSPTLDQTLIIGTNANSVGRQTINFKCVGTTEPSNYLSSIASARDESGGRLMFSTTSNANPGVLTERMRIDSAGNVGIATNSLSAYRVNINGKLNATELWANTAFWASDSRVKNSIEDANLDICYDNIAKTKLRRFEWDQEKCTYENSRNIETTDEETGEVTVTQIDETLPVFKDKHSLGIIAQEYAELFPKNVQETSRFGFSDFKCIDKDQLFYSMLGCIQMLQQKVENQQVTIDELKKFIIV